ncbi:MAG: hypothetical protein AAGI90_00670 [Chlamydiota bacterium]
MSVSSGINALSDVALLASKNNLSNRRSVTLAPSSLPPSIAILNPMIEKYLGCLETLLAWREALGKSHTSPGKHFFFNLFTKNPSSVADYLIPSSGRYDQEIQIFADIFWSLEHLDPVKLKKLAQELHVKTIGRDQRVFEAKRGRALQTSRLPYGVAFLHDLFSHFPLEKKRAENREPLRRLITYCHQRCYIDLRFSKVGKNRLQVEYEVLAMTALIELGTPEALRQVGLSLEQKQTPFASTRRLATACMVKNLKAIRECMKQRGRFDDFKPSTFVSRIEKYSDFVVAPALVCLLSNRFFVKKNATFLSVRNLPCSLYDLAMKNNWQDVVRALTQHYYKYVAHKYAFHSHLSLDSQKALLRQSLHREDVVFAAKLVKNFANAKGGVLDSTDIFPALVSRESFLRACLQRGANHDFVYIKSTLEGATDCAQVAARFLKQFYLHRCYKSALLFLAEKELGLLLVSDENQEPFVQEVAKTLLIKLENRELPESFISANDDIVDTKELLLFYFQRNFSVVGMLRRAVFGRDVAQRAYLLGSSIFEGIFGAR